MSNINQITTINLLNKISETNAKNNASTNKSQSFESVLKNTLGSSVSSSNTNEACSSCNSSNTNVIKTIFIAMNNNRLGNILGNSNVIGNLPVDNNTSDKSTSDKMDEAMKLLNEQLGKDYVWGATGPNSFDCSGLTQYIYKTALGKDIPRVSYEQAEYGQEISREDLQVGDLVFFDTMNKGRVSHVGIYIGNNEFIHAANSNKGVIKSSLSGYYETTYKGARRP